MFVPVQTSTEIAWLRALARIPLLGAFLMLLVTGWPLAVYIVTFPRFNRQSSIILQSAC